MIESIKSEEVVGVPVIKLGPPGEEKEMINEVTYLMDGKLRKSTYRTKIMRPEEPHEETRRD